MSNSNQTIYSFSNDTQRITTCMMAIRDVRTTASLYVPFDWLNSGISKEDVYRWNDIGNKTIFPSKVSECFLDTKNLYRDDGPQTPPKYKKYLGLKITAKPYPYKYKQFDAKEVIEGTLVSLYLDQNTDFRTKTNVYKPMNGITYPAWNGFASDHQLADTGECLFEYIKRTESDYVEIEEEVKPNNTFEITIDCGTTLSNSHKLAILTFYRFLWSNLYKGLVVNTLKLTDLEIDPWEALYYSMSIQQYDSYYGLNSKPGFKPMDEVITALIRGNNINKSFSANIACKHTILNPPDIKTAIEEFKSNSNFDLAIVVRCITNKLSSVSFGFEYNVTNSNCSWKYNVLNCNDYCKRLMLKSNFIVKV